MHDPIYIIEAKECGVWETIDEAECMEDAIMLASSHCANLPEDQIRISTPDNSIL